MIIITLNKRKKSIIYFMGIEWFFIWTNFTPFIPFTQGCFVTKLVEIGQVVLEKKILKFSLQCHRISGMIKISLRAPKV